MLNMEATSVEANLHDGRFAVPVCWDTAMTLVADARVIDVYESGAWSKFQVRHATYGVLRVVVPCLGECLVKSDSPKILELLPSDAKTSGNNIAFFTRRDPLQ